MSNLKLKNKKTGKWEEIDCLVGKEGPAGPSNSLSIGTVSKGENASASITGNSPNQVLDLVLPKGDPGPQGKTGPKPIKGEDYFTADDIEDLNTSGIEKYVLLSDMSSSAPEDISLNSKYYNTSSKLIFSSIDEEHWSDFSETPKKNVFYINTKDGSMYYWNGFDMVLIMPNNSLYFKTCTDENHLLDKNGNILDPSIPHLECEIITNDNGTAIKYNNGVMICSNTQIFTNVKVTSTWGSCYASSVDARLFDDYPVPFVNEPQCTFTIKSTSGDCWLCSRGTSAEQTNKPPNWQVIRPNPSTIASLTICYIAIGKWK